MICWEYVHVFNFGEAGLVTAGRLDSARKFHNKTSLEAGC